MTTDFRPLALPATVESLAPWTEALVFGAAEAHAAAVTTRGAASADPLVQLGAAFAVRAPLHGDSCVDVSAVRATVEVELGRRAGDATVETEISEWLAALPWPNTTEWLDALRVSDLVRSVDGHEFAPAYDDRPLVL